MDEVDQWTQKTGLDMSKFKSILKRKKSGDNNQSLSSDTKIVLVNRPAKFYFSQGDKMIV